MSSLVGVSSKLQRFSMMGNALEDQHLFEEWFSKTRRKSFPRARVVLSIGSQRSRRSRNLEYGVESHPVPALCSGYVTVPASYYQILGLQHGSSEKQIIAAYTKLKILNADEAYSVATVFTRQELLEDAKAKTIADAKDGKSSIGWEKISIPMIWLSAALALLQVAGEDELVITVGTQALQDKQIVALYRSDIVLAVALSKCSRAKKFFELPSFGEGFEELVQAHKLLKQGGGYLRDTKLVAKIEASLEEMAPACVLERLARPCAVENEELRSNAVAALRELIRQGLSGEPSCSVRHWESFLSQAMAQLRAAEVCELLQWDEILLTRKQAAGQNSVINVNCLYTALVAHIALGFSSRQPSLIQKAAALTRSLAAADDVDVGVERVICAALLGNAEEAYLCLETCQVTLAGSGLLEFTESWLKNEVLKHFQDCQQAEPSVAGYYSDSTVQAYFKEIGGRPLLRAGEFNRIGSDSPHSSHRITNQHPDRQTKGNSHLVEEKPQRLLETPQGVQLWQMMPKLMVAGIITFASSALALHFPKVQHAGSVGVDYQCEYCSCNNDDDSSGSFRNRLSSAEISGRALGKTSRSMSRDEAEALIRHWQTVKAAALGPQYASHCLPEVLADEMLDEWQTLAERAKESACYWRFVLLRLEIVHAHIITDKSGWETAEMEVILEEAAELVENQKPINSNYHSIYRAKYELGRAFDRTWRICRGKIES